MLNRWRLSTYMLLALIAGVLFAGAFTDITYPCPLLPGDAGCVSYEKAVMHPSDLASNYQGSLAQFVLKFLVVFAIVLVLLIAFHTVWTRLIKRVVNKVVMNFHGIIIEESLANPEVLKKVNIISTKVEPVTDKHKTPWLKQWTLHTVEIAADQAEEIAREISQAIETSHNAWYADFKTDSHHFIVYPNKVFFIDRSQKAQYDEATQYGISLGMPDYQVDFSPDVKQWERDKK